MAVQEEALRTLGDLLGRIRLDSPDEFYRVAARILQAQEQVRSRYRPIFCLEGVRNLREEDFRGFLLFENNQHWSGLHRQSGWMTEDMPRLREALALLVDEDLAIQTRLNRLRPKTGEPMIKGLGRSVITAILQIVYPDKYGVWNQTAETGMKKLGLWPQFPRGSSFAERYGLVNRVLLDTAQQLNVDLWTLDALWWRLTLRGSPRFPDDDRRPGTGRPPIDEGGGLPEVEAAFGLERHLHDFLADNWQATELAREWDLLEEDGEQVGSHYDTGEVGEIDILARHRSENRWLVIELKRNQTSDDTVGQVLRYMGWVRRHRGEDGATVEGLIICRQIDKRMQYALDGQADIRCMTYQVSFSLAPVPEL